MNNRNFLVLLSILIGLMVLSTSLLRAEMRDGELLQGEHSLLATQDLSTFAEISRRQQVPVLLMFSEPGCEFCERLEKEVLHPMTRNGDHPERVLIAKIQVVNGVSLRDFDGSPVSITTLSQRHGIKVFPTVVLVDHHGEALATKLVGYGSPDFYGAYLEKAIIVAQQQLGKFSSE